jgi:hypothetical protein
MNKYDFSQYADKSIFLSEDFSRVVQSYRIHYLQLAQTLIVNGKIDSAEKVLDKCSEWFIQSVIPYDVACLYIGRAYLECSRPTAIDKGLNYLDVFVDQILDENTYYMKFKGKKAEIVARNVEMNRQFLYAIDQQCKEFMPKLDAKYTPTFEAIAAKTGIQ